MNFSEIEKGGKKDEGRKIETPETESPEVIKSPEDLAGLAQEKIKEGEAACEELKSDGQERINKANDSIGLSAKRVGEIKTVTGIDKKEEEIEMSARKIVDTLRKELEGMFLSGESIEKIEEQVGKIEIAHKEVMAEMRKKHEEEMKKIEELEANPDETRKKAERGMFGGKTLEEAHADSQGFLKKLQEDALRNMQEKTQTNSADQTASRGSELEKEKKENAQRLKEMQEFAKQTIKETIEGVQRARGENQVGEKVQVKTCPKCGAESDMSANFCGSCGSKLEIPKNEKKEEGNEDPADKIKKAANFPELFVAIREIGPVKNSFDVEQKSPIVGTVDPERAIDAIKELFSEDPKMVIQQLKSGKLMSFLKENGVRDKVLEIFEKAA